MVPPGVSRHIGFRAGADLTLDRPEVKTLKARSGERAAHVSSRT
jgi:hypothetical protein